VIPIQLYTIEREAQQKLYLQRYSTNILAVEAELKQYLLKKTKHTINDESRIRAAVLIPIYKKDGQHHILFTKRSTQVKNHRGQVAFPGGVRDKEDKTLQDTALREATEEVGLKPKDVEVLGELDDEITTTSNFIVTPFVGMIPYPYRFIQNKAEVEKLIRVPLAALMEENNIRPDIETLEGGIVVDSFSYYYKGFIIWGATARILNKLLDIIREITAHERKII
jgi:8-oxo-dGTP pyrophosphatase MutT (NUDIX family)